MRRIPDHKMFFKIFNILCESGILSSVHVLSERGYQLNLEE